MNMLSRSKIKETIFFHNKKKLILKVFLIGIILSLNTRLNGQTLVVPPGPGDLSAASHLWQSDDYTVEVKKSGDANYTTCFVYKTDNWASNYWNGERRPQVAASFTNFSFDGTPVDVRITTSFTANSVTVRPISFGVTPTINGNVITFTLTTARKVSVEVNNRLNPLFVFADKPDVVPAPSSVTHYYGPGYHNIGLHKQLNSNETVYIAGGAVLEGTFYIPTNSHDITVRGRGIISGGKLPTAVERTNKIDSIQKYAVFTGRKDKYGTTIHYNLNFEGFTMVSTCGTHFAMVNTNHQNHDNTFRNLKEIDWSVNTDNVFDGDNNIVDDCFFFLNDDMTVTRSSFNLKITNCTFWNFIGRLLWTANYGTSADCLWENIEVIGDDKGPDFTDINSATSGMMKNFTFRNINIESRVSKFINIKSGTTRIENWLFENITFPDLKADEGAFVGNSSGTIDVTFKNLKMGGSYISSLEEGNMTANQYCDIKFEVGESSEINIKQGSIDIPDNTGNFNFGDVPFGTPKTVSFTIENKGNLPLNLTGTPKVTVTGTGFSLESDPPAVVNANGNVTFMVKLTTTANSSYSGTISIPNDDANESPYNFTITGNGYDDSKAVQTITFGALPSKVVGDPDFAPGATASSGLPISYTSSNPDVATIVNGQIHIIGVGTSTITASQPGDANTNPAKSVVQSLIVGATGGTNLVSNPTFDSATGWAIANSGTGVGAMALTQQPGYTGNACKVTITNIGTDIAHVQLRYLVPVTLGKTYTVKFKASADAPRTINIAMQQNTSPWTVYRTHSGINLTTEPTTFGPFSFAPTKTDPTNLLKFMIALSTTDVYIDDVEVYESSATTIRNVLANDNPIEAYPNPAKDVLNVVVPALEGECFAVEIRDLQGRSVVKKKMVATNSGKNLMELNVTSIAAGTYFVKVVNGKTMQTKLIVIL